MTDHVHIRLMVTRGIKRTPYQDPRVTIGPATIVIIAEYKNPKPETLERGIRLFTVHVRRGYPDVQDPKLNSHSKLNCITACIQATRAGADEALMLDPHGFVATCNSTHFFIVRKGEVWTSTGMYCLPGITRANVLRVCRENGIPAIERKFQPDRCLRRRRSVRHRHVRRRRAGDGNRRTHDQRCARADGRASAESVSRIDRTRRRRAQLACMKPVRIAMWSGPRNISTAMMRSFENRGDCAVVDEPFYAHYLAETQSDHPGPRRRDRGRRNGLAQRRRDAHWTRAGRCVRVLSEAHDASHAAAHRPRVVQSSDARVPDPRSARSARLVSENPRAGDGR